MRVGFTGRDRRKISAALNNKAAVAATAAKRGKVPRERQNDGRIAGNSVAGRRCCRGARSVSRARTSGSGSPKPSHKWSSVIFGGAFPRVSCGDVMVTVTPVAENGERTGGGGVSAIV